MWATTVGCTWVGAGFLTTYPESIFRDHAGYYDRGDTVVGHHRNWLDCIRDRRLPHCDIAIGAQSTIVAHLGCMSRWLGRRLQWDPAKEEFLQDDEANRFRRRAMRSALASVICTRPITHISSDRKTRAMFRSNVRYRSVSHGRLCWCRWFGWVSRLRDDGQETLGRSPGEPRQRSTCA